MRLEREALILKGGIKLGILDPQPEYYVSYYEEVVAKLTELLIKERHLNNDLERLYVRGKLLSYSNISGFYPDNEIDSVKASIEKINEEDKKNKYLINRYQAELKRLEVLIPDALKKELTPIPTREK